MPDVIDASLSDHKGCKTRYLTAKLWECLAENATDCPFRIKLGMEYFCLHQDCEEFGRLLPGKGTDFP